MNLKIFQIYFIKCLIEANTIKNYSEAAYIFKKRFADIEFILKDDIVKKLISSKGSTKNLTIKT